MSKLVNWYIWQLSDDILSTINKNSLKYNQIMLQSAAYLWPGSYPPLSRAKFSVASSPALWTIATAVFCMDGPVCVVMKQLDTPYRTHLIACFSTTFATGFPVPSNPSGLMKRVRHVSLSIIGFLYPSIIYPSQASLLFFLKKNLLKCPVFRTAFHTGFVHIEKTLQKYAVVESSLISHTYF